MEINKHFKREIKDDPEHSPSALFVYLKKLLLWAANLGLGLRTVLCSFTSNLCWLLSLLDKSSICRVLKNQCRAVQESRVWFPSPPRGWHFWGIRNRMPSTSPRSRSTVLLPNAEHAKIPGAYILKGVSNTWRLIIYVLHLGVFSKKNF